MITRHLAGATWLLLLVGLLTAAAPQNLWALTYSFTTKPDQDALNFVFDKQGIFPTITRTGLKQITLQFPPGTITPPKLDEEINFKQSRHILNVTVAGNKVLINLNTDKFGFVGWPSGEQELKLQIYRDPMGANWTPPKAGKPGETTASAETPAAPQGVLPDGVMPDVPDLETLPAQPGGSEARSPIQLPKEFTDPTVAPEEQPQGGSSVGGAIGGTVGASGTAPAVLPDLPQTAEPRREPYYAAAYAVRSKIERVGPDEAPFLRPSGVSDSLAGMPAPGGGTVAAQTGGTGATPVTPVAPVVKLPPIPKEITGEGEVKSRIARPGQKTVDLPPDITASPESARASGKISRPATAAAPAAPTEAAVPTEQELAGAPPAAEKEEKITPEEEQYNALVAAQADKINGQYEKARKGMEDLKARPDLARDIREELLYSLAELYFDMYSGKMADNYGKIEAAVQEAINYNTKSQRVPGALLQLGLINLRVGNLPEARAYFTILKKKFPNDENVPLINYYWGEYYYEQKNFQQAAKEFQILVEEYPESKFVREGSMGLAKSFVKLGHFDEAAQIADYIDKRWPRYYVEYPALLRITGDIYYKLGNFEKAKDLYLAYYNIIPESPEVDLVMARLGDVYSRLGRRVPALQFYDMTAKRFPDKEGGLLAKMRLVEHGVYDDPTIQQMFRAFKEPSPTGPDQIYSDIVKEHPDSPLAPVAQLKLAIWRLFKGNYLDCIDAGTQFLKMFPDNPLLPRVEEVAAQAFDKVAITLMNEQNYPRIMSLWRENPVLKGAAGKIGEKARLSLALSMLRTGSPRESLSIALPLIEPGQTDSGTMALMLALSIYQQGDAWKDVLRLVNRVRDWNFSPDQRRRVEFAAAMALENLGDTKSSRPLWARLAADSRLDPGMLAYAMYYQGRQAKADNDQEKVQMFASQAVELFQESGKDPSKLLDSTNMLIDAQIKLGLFPDALKWSQEYAKRVEEGGPDWAANQFRMASIQKDLGDEAAWKATLEKMREDMPDTLYGKMAASALSSSALERRAEALTRPN